MGNSSSEEKKIEGEDLNKNPHRSIRVITCFLDNGKPSYSTGVLVSKNLFLTAANVIYNKRQNAVSTRFKFYHENNGIGKDSFQLKDSRYLPQFKTCPYENQLQYDYGLIKIQQDMNNPILYNQFTKLLVTCKNCLKKQPQLKIGIYGYPLNKMGSLKYLLEGGMTLYTYGFQIKNKVELIDHQQFIISYKVNPESGQNNSPIIMDENIIGIHNGSKGDVNIGRLVTPEMAQNIIKWSKQLQGDPITIKYNGQCSFIFPMKKYFLGLNIEKNISKIEQETRKASRVINKIKESDSLSQKIGVRKNYLDKIALFLEYCENFEEYSRIEKAKSHFQQSSQIL